MANAVTDELALWRTKRRPFVEGVGNVDARLFFS